MKTKKDYPKNPQLIKVFDLAPGSCTVELPAGSRIFRQDVYDKSLILYYFENQELKDKPETKKIEVKVTPVATEHFEPTHAIAGYTNLLINNEATTCFVQTFIHPFKKA